MGKTKEQLLIEKLRKAGRLTRMRPGMPPLPMPGMMGDPMGRMPGPMGVSMNEKIPGPMGGPMAGHMPGPMGGPMDGKMPGPMGGLMAGHMPGPRPGCGHGPGHRGPKGCHMPREILLLTVLENGENGVRQKDIAEAIGINASSLSEQIDALEADRYLERKANPEDKRSTLIVLTEKGRARAYEVQDERQKMAADFCAKLTEEEKDTLIALLDKLLDGSV